MDSKMNNHENLASNHCPVQWWATTCGLDPARWGF